MPVIADSALSSTAAYALTEQNRYTAGNAAQLAERIDYWYEHRDELPGMGERYIALARSLTLEKCAGQALEMMREACRRQS